MKEQTCIILTLLSLLICPKSSHQSDSWKVLIDRSYHWSKSSSNNWKAKYNAYKSVTNISEVCDQGILETLKAIEDQYHWAISMFNAWGSFPPKGMMIGTHSDFGSFDQCVDIAPNPTIGEPQYCFVDLTPPIPQPIPRHQNMYTQMDVLPEDQNYSETIQIHSKLTSFHYWAPLSTAICVPSKCSDQDIAMLAQQFATEHGLMLKGVRCQTVDRDNKYAIYQIVSM